jgi:hypothetical protein
MPPNGRAIPTKKTFPGGCHPWYCTRAPPISPMMAYSPDEHARLYRWYDGRFNGQLCASTKNCSRIFYLPATWDDADNTSITRSPSTASACLFGRSWLSDKAAARCLSVTVICGAAFAEAADFLAAEAAFFAGGMTISLSSCSNLLGLSGFEQTSLM